MELKSIAKFSRTAPDKIRVLTSLVKGKNIPQALSQLQFSGKAAARPLSLALKQAQNEANQKNIMGELTVKSVQVDEGPKLKRRRIRQQGRATAILKRGSHITIIVTDENKNSKIENRELKKETKKEENGS